MDGDLGLTGKPLLAVKAVLVLIIVGILTFVAYIWWIAIPEQQAIIDKNEAQIQQDQAEIKAIRERS